MKPFNARKVSVLILCVVIISVVINPVMSEDDAEEAEEEGEDEPPPTCKKVLFGLVQGFLTSALTCLGGKLPLRSPFELATRFYCVIKCVLSVEGILNEEGILDEVSALFYFQEKIPESIRDTVIGGAQPCLELAKDFNPKEYYCQSYSAFTQCVLPVFISTLGPYALDCFSTPGLGFLFAIINVLVPRASPPAMSNELRKRMAEAQATYRLRKAQNGTITSSNSVSKIRTSSNTTLQYPTRRNSFFNNRRQA